LLHIGEILVRTLVERFQARGLNHIDLSVLHDNDKAIALYDKLGFRRIPVYAIKTRNSINERLYTGPAPEEDALNPYARIIIDEARRRGISVAVDDAEGGFFSLSFGGRSIACRESLSDLTSAVAMSRCDDKAVTRRLLLRAGISVPAQRVAGSAADNAAFLAEHGSVVVKPARGEQGQGVAVDLRSSGDVESAVAAARAHCDTVLLEQMVAGDDLRIIVIDGEVVAGAIRRPAEIVGTGMHTVAQLIERQSRRRAAATGGESRIPVDDQTQRLLADAAIDMETVLEEGRAIRVRKTANLHTGGTIHDVTGELHRGLCEAAVTAARVLDIPVVGLDFIVPDVHLGSYHVIEANERPGLANHAPAPTAQRFVDLLFPQTARWADRSLRKQARNAD
jgi:GNAT-family acetyltransferase (TIGR03103 family)